MSYLPILRRRHPDRLVLDSSSQAAPVLIALTRAWREDPVGVGALFADIADRDDQVRSEGHRDDLGDAEYVRDQLVEQLIAKVGGAEFPLSRLCNRNAVRQARRIAAEAQHLADFLDRHADLVTLAIEESELMETARQAAALADLLQEAWAADLSVRLVACEHCSCWARHANGLPCCKGCGTPGHAMTEPAG
ncbi:hypothetical protein [Streptomyces sp. NPDC059378]|uniref:hypothetical protein n=1 Tax=Streptomyces sp. NPDC059378 TaxID=3346815 RepID=UPI0036C14BC7